ncbi:MAG: hypothetical protein BWY75_03499 [bacterium ADurb.Bin425]|nr:MAG: hypothetical protein BWY75_03499 [bacterium ADurb.Bin425]
MVEGIVFAHRPHEAQGSASGNNGHHLDQLFLAFEVSDDCMSSFVIGCAPEFFQQDFLAFGNAEIYSLNGFEDVFALNQSTTFANGEESRFVHYICQVSARAEYCHSSYFKQADIAFHFVFFNVLLEYGFSAFQIWQGHFDDPVKATGSKQSRIEHTWIIGGADGEHFMLAEAV